MRMRTAAQAKDGSTGWEPLRDADLLCAASFISGAPVLDGAHEAVMVLDPATGESIGQVPALGAAEARAATDAAVAAFPDWASLLPLERSRLLRRGGGRGRAARGGRAGGGGRGRGGPGAGARGEI